MTGKHEDLESTNTRIASGTGYSEPILPAGLPVRVQPTESAIFIHLMASTDWNYATFNILSHERRRLPIQVQIGEDPI